jgi:hypothetical protein
MAANKPVYEAELESMEVMVHYPDGSSRSHVLYFRGKEEPLTIAETKRRLMEGVLDADPDNYMMLLTRPNGATKVMNNDTLLQSYKDSLQDSTISVIELPQ